MDTDTLPIPVAPAPADPGQAASGAPAAPQQDPAAAMTILLVEDEPTLQELYFERFTADGISVLQAYDGMQALEILEGHPEIRLVLLDLMLPKLSGYDVLNHIKHHPSTQHLPVIIVSALADIDDQARGLQLGASDYITKGDMLPSAVIEKIKSYVVSVPGPAAG